MPTPETYIRLSQLTEKIQTVLNNAFSNQHHWLVADVTNHTFRANKNYHNFDLVEKSQSSSEMLAKIPCKAWGMGSTKISNFERVTGQKFTNNINVLIYVKVTFHPVYGLSLEIADIDPNFTIGVLEQQRQATLELLVNNNAFIIKVDSEYITTNKKLVLRPIIQTIAIISSKTSAGITDFKHTLTQNNFGYKFSIDPYYATVQGESNVQEIFDALVNIHNSKKAYDAVVIIRGGGAQTDFFDL